MDRLAHSLGIQTIVTSNRDLARQLEADYGYPEQSRDFTYVENVVNVNLQAAESKFDGSPLVNIAYGQRTTINQLAKTLNELTRQNLPRSEEHTSELQS